MYISINWLKDFINLPSKLEATEIAQKLTAHTAEVEGLLSLAERFDRVVVGKVLAVLSILKLTVYK